MSNIKRAEKRLKRHIAKELIINGYDQCDINQVLDNFKLRLQAATNASEKAEIIKEYQENYNIETNQL